MKPERYRRVKEVFAAAVEVDTGARAEVLARECAGDFELRAEVESLLAHDEPAADFIEESAFEVAARTLADGEPALPQGWRIGPYRVVREIGRGGMGVVYLAERDDEQFRKRVAVKLVKRGMDTDAVVRRFRNERQILAELEHPNIARLLDGGATETGLPYLVMEYVEGRPFTDYCDGQRLTTKERLQLFREICAAVSYAHQHLVVHRDLKPSNILVTADGTPKLLDFGIAKVLGPEQADLTREQTRADLRVLTPDYASPEQVRGERVTTASDIYSLGVILYELLTGQRPYRLKERSTEEVVRAVCEEEPVRPSQAVADSKLREAGSKSPPPPQPQSLRGDLDNIVLKALRKEPQRRYASSQELSGDIRRHIEGLPVVARPDTFAYRASKFVSRNKVGVAAAALVAAAVVFGVGATIWEARVAKRQRDEAQTARAKAERISEFLASALSYSDPTAASPGGNNHRDATINQMLDDFAPRIESELADQPEIKASLLRTVGAAYLSQARVPEAERYLNTALETQLKLGGEDDIETARALAAVADMQNVKGDYAASEKTALRALAVFRVQRARGRFDARAFVGALNTYGDVLWTKGDYRASEAAYGESLTVSSQLQGEDRGLVAEAKTGLGECLYANGRLDEAAALLGEAVAEYRALPRQRWKLTSALNPLGQVLMWEGRYAEALAALRESESIAREVFGESNDGYARTLYMQAYALCLRGDYAEASRALDRAEAIYQRFYPDDKVNQANLGDARGMIMTRTGHPQQGEVLARRATQLYQSFLSRGASGITLAREHWAESLTAQKRYAEAEEVLSEAYADAREAQGEKHWRVRQVARDLSNLYGMWGRPEESARFLALSVVR